VKAMCRKQKCSACIDYKYSDFKFTTFIFANLKCFGIFAPLKKPLLTSPMGRKKEKKNTE
jgi:hypothetical protein